MTLEVSWPEYTLESCCVPKTGVPRRPPATRPRLPNPYLLMTGRLGMDEEVVLPVT